MGAILEVKVLPEADHSERSYASDTMHNFEFDREVALDRQKNLLDIRHKR